jgi:hypothetical protein
MEWQVKSQGVRQRVVINRETWFSRCPLPVTRAVKEYTSVVVYGENRC